MNREQHIRVIIAGGGTGGHIFPALSIANALRRNLGSCDILFVGAKGKMEMEKVPKEGYSIVGLDIAGFNRSSLLKNIGLPLKIVRSFLQARKILRNFKPHIAVGVGGYASFPVLFMAQRMGIPTLIQEQNSFAGKSNKILGRRAKAICVAYGHMERFFPADRIIRTGNPVRATIGAASITREEACSFFNLDKEKKVVFAFGGSLGAKSINDTLAASLDYFSTHHVQLLWQTGTTHYQAANEQAKHHEPGVQVREFIREMDMAYAAADIIISRAGASSIAELCIVGKPVIFVPFPHASEDHQTHNALALVKHNAAVMVKDQDVKQELMQKLDKLLHNETQCKLLRTNLKPLAVTNADQLIADKIIHIATA